MSAANDLVAQTRALSLKDSCSTVPIAPAGALFARVRQVTDNAQKTGAIFSIHTDITVVSDASVDFVVRVSIALGKKPAGPPRDLGLSSQNPFADPDPALVVQPLSATHRLILNKFNIVPYHLLVVTTLFEPQTDLLNMRDFEASLKVMVEIPGLLFYNSGNDSGASQPHKHMQYVPYPLVPGSNCVPMEPVILAAAPPSHGQPYLVPSFGFEHFAARLDPQLLSYPQPAAAAYLETVYHELMARTSLDFDDVEKKDEGDLSYNFLMTKDWMLVVVRASERSGSVCVNSLGFAGTLFVKTEAQLQEVKRTGPMTILRTIAAPPRADPLPPAPAVQVMSGVISQNNSPSPSVDSSPFHSGHHDADHSPPPSPRAVATAETTIAAPATSASDSVVPSITVSSI